MTDEEPDVFADAHANVAALCAAYVKEVAASRAELDEMARTHDLKRGATSCAPLPGALAFTGDATYRRAFFVELTNGLNTAHKLVVEVPRGLVLTRVGWWTDNPLDPGCMRNARMSGLESLRVQNENGHLVAVLKGTRGWLDPKGNVLSLGVRDATWCMERGGKLTCKTYGTYREPLERFVITPGGELLRQ